jgi:hypothetical protein
VTGFQNRAEELGIRLDEFSGVSPAKSIQHASGPLGAFLGAFKASGNMIHRDNAPARRLYESVGFLEFGVEPKASKYGDKYYDETLIAP